MDLPTISILGVYFVKLFIQINKEITESENIHYKLQKTKIFLKNELGKTEIKKPIYMKLSKEEKKTFAKIIEKLKEKKELYNFYLVLSKNTKEENLINFINNVQSLKIYKKKKNKLKMLFENDSTLGKYISPDNEIFIYNNKTRTLNHELLHMSSSRLDYAVIGFYTKFSHSFLDKYKFLDDYYNEIGRGLNEGYTELLNNKLFKSRSTNYLYLQKIALLIEQFYENKEDMKNDYFNSNISGVIYELSKYMEIEEVIDLLVDIDELKHNNKSIKLIKYIKIKRKLLEAYLKNKKTEETEEFKKTYKSNHLFKILTKKI